jgi:hypothetical protein
MREEVSFGETAYANGTESGLALFVELALGLDKL